MLRLVQVVQGFSRVFWILWVGALINRLGGFVLPLLALYLTGERGLPVEQVGLIVALLGAGSLAAGPTGGFLADRFGRRRTLILGLVAGALAMIHLAFARTPAHLAVATFLLGLVGDLYRPAVSAAIADLVPPEDRVRAYGLLYWAINLGFAVAGLLGGVLAQRGWMLLFIGDAATTLVFAVVIWRNVPETRPAGTASDEDRSTSPLEPLAHRPFVIFCALTMVLAAVFHQAFITLPIDLRAHGLQPATYGALISINGVLIVVLQPFAARFFGRLPRHRVLAGAAAVIGLGFGLTGLVDGLWGYAGAIIVWTLGEIVMSGIGPALVADLAPEHQRGAYQGIYQASWGGAALVAPVLGSLMLGRFGAGALWASCAAVGVLAGAGQLALGPVLPAALKFALPGAGAAPPARPPAPPA